MVSVLMLLIVCSRGVAFSISRPLARSSSIVGSFESRRPIVLVRVCSLMVVFYVGTLVVIEWSSSSSFILASNRLSETSVGIVLFIIL